MKKKTIALLGAGALLLAGCGSTTAQTAATTQTTQAAETAEAADTEETDTTGEEAPSLVSTQLVTNVYGDGQKPWYVILTYDRAISAESVDASDYEVDGYTVENVYVNSDPEIPEDGTSTDGTYVIVELSTDYTTRNYGGDGTTTAVTETSAETTEDASGDSTEEAESADASTEDTVEATDAADTGSTETENAGPGSADASGTLPDAPDGTMDGKDGGPDGGQGGGPGGGAGMAEQDPSNEESVTLTQVGEIESADGVVLSPSEESVTTDYTENENLLVENFTQYTYTEEDGTELMYSLYLPEDYDEDTSYPLVLFMPDATGEGDDQYLALTESLGGVIWTEDSWQEDNPCIVLVPQYTEDNTEDDSYTMALVQEIMDSYSVDEDRVYLVGQSSGTIRSIKLMIDYPDVFAGAMLVAGQADSAYEDQLASLADQNIWFICSEKDARAYPGITEIVDAVEGAGTEVTTSQWSAKLSDEEQEENAKEQEAAGTHINWTVFDGDTVMESNIESSDVTEHMNTWRVAYNLDTIREWLFAQTRS